MPLLGLETPVIERASINEDFVLYVESSKGGLVTNGYHLNGTEVTMDEVPNIRSYGKSNVKFNSAVQRGKAMSRGSYNGIIAINDFIAIAQSAIAKGVVTSPTNNGVYILSLGTPSAGTFTLTYGAQTTTAIAYNASASVIQAALNLLSTSTPNGFIVTQLASFYFQINLTGPISTGGNLTGNGASLTAGTFLLTSPTSTGLGVYRWTYNVKASGTDDYLTYQYLRGMFDQAFEAERGRFMCFDGITLKINQQEATINGGVYAQTLEPENSIVSANVGELALVPAHMDTFDVYLGRAKNGSTGPDQLLRNFDIEIGLSGKQAPFLTNASSIPSFTGVLDHKPDTSVRLTVMKNAEGRAIRTMVKEGNPLYLVVESVGADIIPGFPYRFKVQTPVLLTDYPSNDSDGASTYQFTGSLSVLGALTPQFIVDTSLASLA